MLWHTETDEFQLGQWLKGQVVYASLSANGKHLAMGLRSQRRGQEYTVVSRAPYFTALSIAFGWLLTSSIGFTKEGALDWDAPKIENRSQNKCPYPITNGASHNYDPSRYLTGIATAVPREAWISPQGRNFETREGKIYDVTDGMERELIDLGPYSFTEVETPDWAKNW